MDRVSFLAMQRLEDSAVFAVYRQDRHMVFFRQRHNNVPGCHQGLFIGKGDCLSGFYGCNCSRMPSIPTIAVTNISASGITAIASNPSIPDSMVTSKSRTLA